MKILAVFIALWTFPVCLTAGPYSNWDEGVEPNQCVAWATGWTDSFRTNASFGAETNVLGPATGDNMDVFSLGDAGYITVTFDAPIYDCPGADFAVWENGFNSGGSNNIFAELMFVDVSSDGTNWTRFDSVSLTADSVGPYGTINSTDVYNLAGKHANAHGVSWGTPFDLDELTNDVNVIAGLVDLNNINFVKLKDVIGDGSTYDSLGNPIYDPDPFPGGFTSWGADPEAVGVLSAVPEPCTLFLILAGLLLVGVKRFFRV